MVYGIDLFGFCIALECQDDPTIGQFAEVFAQCRKGAIARPYFGDCGEADLLIKIHLLTDETSAPRVGPQAEHLQHFMIYPEMAFDLYQDSDDILWTAVDQCDWTRVDYARRVADIHVHASRLDARPKYITMALLFPILLDFFQERGMVFLHGACLEKDGRSILMVAPSHGGKTTTAFTLATAGYKVLTDDMCLIHAPEGGELRMYGFRQHFSIRTQSFELLPALGERVGLLGTVPQGQYPDDTDPKVRLPINALFPDAYAPAAASGLVLFLEIGAPDHALIPISARGDALDRLWGCSLFVTGPRHAFKRVLALSELLASSAVYILRLGLDTSRLHTVIDQALAELVP